MFLLGISSQYLLRMLQINLAWNMIYMKLIFQGWGRPLNNYACTCGMWYKTKADVAIYSLVKLVSFQFYPRYSAVRKQFGPPGKDEIPVLEYQMQVSKGLLEYFLSEDHLLKV